MKTKIIAENAPKPAGPYSQAIVSDNRIYVAGQGPLNPVTGETPATVAEQTRQVLTNVKNILEAAGATMNDVVKVGAYLADMKDFAEYNQVYKEFFDEPYPVRTTVGAQLNNILVEVDVIAEK